MTVNDRADKLTRIMHGLNLHAQAARDNGNIAVAEAIEYESRQITICLNVLFNYGLS